MAWRLAKSLETLRSQVNAKYPNRSKASDGTIGDEAHRKEASDHNPNGAGVVTALDLTHDPKNGFDAHKTANTLLAKRHPNLKYIISNSRIGGSHTGWKWTPYSSSNPHSQHIHVSVGRGADGSSTQPYDDTIKWNIGDTMADKFTPAQANKLVAIAFNRQATAQEKKDYSSVSVDKALDAVFKRNKGFRTKGSQYNSVKAKLDSGWAGFKDLVKKAVDKL